MCIRRLPPLSAIRYCIHAADAAFPNRRVADQDLEAEGFTPLQRLLPELRERFPDVWLEDEGSV